MTAPYPAIGSALLKLLGIAFQRAVAGLLQGLHCGCRQPLWVAAELAVVIGDGQLNAGGPAIRRCGLRTGVKIGDLRPEVGHQPRAELVGFGHVAKQRLLGKAAHHHHPIQRWAQTIEAQHPIATAVDRAHLQIQVRRSATVQA